jgi:hypothetical protein
MSEQHAWTLVGIPVYIHAVKFDRLAEQVDVVFTFTTRDEELGAVAQKDGKIVGLWLDFYEPGLGIRSEPKADTMAAHKQPCDGFTMLRRENERLAAYAEELRDALSSIRRHVYDQPSALATAIVATCDAALAKNPAPAVAPYRVIDDIARAEMDEAADASPDDDSVLGVYRQSPEAALDAIRSFVKGETTVPAEAIRRLCDGGRA